MNWISQHYAWLFDGVGGLALVAVLGWLAKQFFNRKHESAKGSAIENKIEDKSKVEISPNFSPSFSPIFSPQVVISSQDKIVEPQREKEKLDVSANLSFLQAKEVLLHQNQMGIWYEASTDLQHATKGIVAPFKNVPKRIGEHTPTASSVTASLVFKGLGHTNDMHINHGVWLNLYEHFATFRSGETHYLLVAAKRVPFVTFDNPHTRNPFQGRLRSGISIHPPQEMTLWLEGVVEIMLVGGGGVTLLHGVFDYSLSVKKMILTQRQPK